MGSPTLATLTDAHVRALLDLGTDDFAHMHAVDVLQGLGWTGDDAQRIKAEAQSIADALTPEVAAVLRAVVRGDDERINRMMKARPGVLRELPAARLVLALRERAGKDGAR